VSELSAVFGIGAVVSGVAVGHCGVVLLWVVAGWSLVALAVRSLLLVSGYWAVYDVPKKWYALLIVGLRLCLLRKALLSRKKRFRTEA
jgi:hypothetical protein